MNRIVNRRTFLESAHAYTRARQPTSQLIAELCTSFAQMLADDLDGRVTVALPEAIHVAREPTQ